MRVTTTTLRVSGGLGGALARRAPIGLPNAYNLAGAITATTTLGRLVEDSAQAIEGYQGSFGRLEWMEIEGRHVVMCLVKNTVSLAEMVQLGPSLAPDVVLLGLNDAPADGRDVSWIWDAPVAALLADRLVVLTGSRSADLELRVKYDGQGRSSLPRIGRGRSARSRPPSNAAVAWAPHRRDRADRGDLHGDDGPAGDRATARRRAGDPA